MQGENMINRLKIHEFHFVLNKSLKVKLCKVSKMLKLNLSKTILFILERTFPISQKIHLFYPAENNGYEKVNWDSHIHIYFSETKHFLYNNLKSIHKDNDTYSIAGKLRYLLKVFIRGVELFGFDRFMYVLKNAKNKMENIIRTKKVWEKIKVRQLLYKKCLSVYYDTNYKAIFIKLLN